MGSMPRVVAIALVALAAAGGAWAALPGMGTVQSVVSADGKLIYEVVWKKGRTTVNLDRNARTVESARLKGKFGFPAPTNAGIDALDTVERHAVCIDLPRRMAQAAFQQVTLKLAAGRLAVRKGTTTVAVIDTKTLHVTR
jgi:hypothetical protein